MCASGGGGLTPSDIAPARLSQQQIDELQRQYRIADVLPLTPLQQGLLFHASTAQASGDDVYAVQLDITVAGAAGSAPAARCGAHGGQPPSQPGGPILRHSSTSRCRSSRLIPMAPWRYVELDADGVDLEEQIQQVCAAERAAVCDLADQPAFRVALIRTADDRHRFVLTNHHIVMDGWSLPILLQEIFASYYGQRLPAAAPYRRFVTWLADRDLDAARAAWRRGAGRLRHPHTGRPAGPVGAGAARRRIVPGARGDHAGARRAGALAPHHRQHRAAGAPGRSC